MMKKTLLIILLNLVIVCSGCSKNPDAYDSNGKPIQVNNYVGKWVIINYWAPWCKPCLTEMPTLETLSQNYPNKLVIIGVSFDGLSNDELNSLSKKLKITYALTSKFPIIKYGVRELPALPITFIINPEGKLVKTLLGPQTKEQFLEIMKL